MKVFSVGNVFNRTINRECNGLTRLRMQKCDIISEFSGTSLLGSSLQGTADFTVDRFLLVSNGKEIGDNSYLEGSNNVVLMQKWSCTGRQTVNLKMGRTDLDVPINSTMGDVGKELYIKGATKIIPTEQKIIVNGKCVPNYMLVGDVALFCTRSKLNITIVSTSAKKVTAQVKSFETFPEVYSLQKIPKRKRSCTDTHRGLKSRRSVTHRMEPSQLQYKIEEASPPVTPVK